jgi:DNA replication and repair protein RecF
VYISRLAVDNFRSWKSLVLDLKPGINVLYGRNGLGKTNLVEALEVLSTGSSHRISSSAPLVQRDQHKATVRANVEDDGKTTTYELNIPVKGVNRGRINGGSSLYMRDLVGRIPFVSFSPDDQRLITGEPNGRRSFLDQTISQLDAHYYQLKQNVNHLAQQRGILLKQLSRDQDLSRDGSTGSVQDNLSTLEVWTGQFIQQGMELTQRRLQFIQSLQKPIKDIYRQLAGQHNDVSINYIPSFSEVVEGGFSSQTATLISHHFQRIYPGELARGQNLIGPQRDDLTFMLNGLEAKGFASNGEEWTIALALRLAQFQLLLQKKQSEPILVLDDVFAQLDEERRSRILNFASQQEQVLITVAASSDMPRTDGANLIDLADLANRYQSFMEEMNL